MFEEREPVGQEELSELSRMVFDLAFGRCTRLWQQSSSQLFLQLSCCILVGWQSRLASDARSHTCPLGEHSTGIIYPGGSHLGRAFLLERKSYGGTKLVGKRADVPLMQLLSLCKGCAMPEACQ